MQVLGNTFLGCCGGRKRASDIARNGLLQLLRKVNRRAQSPEAPTRSFRCPTLSPATDSPGRLDSSFEAVGTLRGARSRVRIGWYRKTTANSTLYYKLPQVFRVSKAGPSCSTFPPNFDEGGTDSYETLLSPLRPPPIQSSTTFPGSSHTEVP